MTLAKRWRNDIHMMPTISQLSNHISTLGQRCHAIWGNISCLQIGRTHHVWDSIESTRLEVRRGVVKSRIVTGTDIVQSLRSKFNQYQIDPTCPLCYVEDEDITHMILQCSALHPARKDPFQKLNDYIISKTDINFWRSYFSNKENLVKLIIDCSQLTELQTVEDLDIH